MIFVVGGAALFYIFIKTINIPEASCRAGFELVVCSFGKH
jgi:hypothetical protein